MGHDSRRVPQTRSQFPPASEVPEPTCRNDRQHLEVAFQENRGAPAKSTFATLSDWSKNSDEGIKYFSGSATYTKSIQADAGWFQPNSSIWLDLGDVKNIAEVTVNGKSAGILWKTPFRVDITKLLKPGANQLELKITNLWVNRMIGDRQPNAPKQYTFTNPVFYKADSPLLPSGLIGPVKLLQSTSASN